MKIAVYIVNFFLFFFPVLSVNAQELISNRSVTGVSYAGNKVNKIYVPPPKSFFDHAGSKGGGKITVFYSGFSAEARVAVDFAVKVLESVLPSDLKMTIRASWTNIPDAGVLGHSSITSLAAGWAINALEPYAYYPVALGEKIAGRNLNEDIEADVELVLNSSGKWYFGTDGNTPVSKYDLVTVVIHELCHGLGFFDSMNAEYSLGSYGIGLIPIIYDKFVETQTETRLTDTTNFTQNTTNLYLALVSGQLFFGGPLTRRYLSGNRPKLYAPSTWDSGSSISHLDEAKTPKADGLMTPFIDYGEAIHNPGNLTISILGDLGWINTRIITPELKDTENHLSDIQINMSVRCDTAYKKNNVGLVYSFNHFLSSDTIIMSPGSSNTFSGNIQIPSYNIKLEYYFFVTDDFSRVFRSPSLAGKSPYSIFIGTDTIKPVITHTPKEYIFEKIDTVLFKADVKDNLGIDTVYLEYRINNGTPKLSGFTKRADNEYSLGLNVKPELLKGGDKLKYRIIAVDKASGRNTRTSPSSDYYSVSVETLLPALRSYSTDFSNSSADFFNSGFQITQPADFNSPGLHSDHPYKSPEQDNKNLEFGSVLRHPIVFDASGMVITYKELVLVEPGEVGSLFGFSDFYDYVIAEASKNYGKTWFPLADGYDSRRIPSWEEAYNSSISGQNSTFIGKESMMLENAIYPRISDKISNGDSLLIRFRLFSDPYSNGWGWAIDDLKINPLVDNIEEIITSEIKIYPNPGNGLINIIYKDENSNDPVIINVFNYAGQRIIQEKSSSENTTLLNISGNPPGLYLILMTKGQTTKTIKYNLIK